MSLRRFHSLLLSPRSSDEDGRRREYIANVILLASIGMLTLLDGLVLYHSIREGPAYQDISFGTFSLIPTSSVLLYVLSRRGYPRIASYGIVIAYFASNSYAAYRWGVGMPVVPLAYALVTIMAGVLVTSGFAFIVALSAGAFTIPVWYAQLHGVIATSVQNPRAADSLVFTAILLVITVVSWLSNREIERSLRRAWISEDALREERGQLAAKVEERTRELREAQFEKLREVYRLAEFGELASGLFHDLTNLLTASMLLKDTARDKEELRVTENRVRDFVEGVRRQLKHEDVNETFSLNEGIAYAVELLANKSRVAKVGIFFRPEAEIAGYGNPFQFHHLMVNLVSNAIEAYRRASPDAEREVNIVLAKEGAAVAVSVADNACGIPESDRQKIFEPFFTTKDDGERIGIGLAIAKRIVEENFKGTISVASEVGKGSTFTVRFPVSY